jgi:hypothetical protein
VSRTRRFPNQKSVEFNQRLRAVGAPGEMILIPGVNQSFIGKTPERAVAATVTFFDRHPK